MSVACLMFLVAVLLSFYQSFRHPLSFAGSFFTFNSRREQVSTATNCEEVYCLGPMILAYREICLSCATGDGVVWHAGITDV